MNPIILVVCDFVMLAENEAAPNCSDLRPHSREKSDFWLFPCTKRDVSVAERSLGLLPLEEGMSYMPVCVRRRR